MYIPKMEKKIEQSFFDFEIKAFELVSSNTRFYWERILVIGCHMLTKSVKISGITETVFCEPIWFQSDEKIWHKYCLSDLCSVSDPLTSWLSISVLIQGFFRI